MSANDLLNASLIGSRPFPREDERVLGAVMMQLTHTNQLLNRIALSGERIATSLERIEGVVQRESN